jgi:hypothetical protein
MTRPPRSRKLLFCRKPEEITAANGPFEIDQEIRKLDLQPRWQSIDEAVSFGRLALRVALEDARKVESHRAADQVKRFERAASLARSAHSALNELLDDIGPAGLPASIAKAVGSRKMAVTMYATDYGPEDAKREVEVLANARDVIAEMRRYAARREKDLDYTRKIKDDKYGKQMFVYRLAEGWIFLTGKKPGRGRDPTHNPFLRFVNSAASDAEFSDVEDFYRALIWALKMLDWYEGMMADEPGNSQQSISGIAVHGPEW